jgi:hypothetical protein
MEHGMQVLILEDDPAFQALLAQAMMAKGFNVLCVASVPAAEAFLRLDMADVLIFGERIDGRLTHPVALLAECRNPLVAAVLLTDRTGPDLDELFDLMPSLVGILGRRVAPPVVTQVVMAAVAGMATESARSRLASRWAAAEADVVDTPVTAAPAAAVAPQAMLSDALPMQADGLTDTVTADLADPVPVAAPVAAAAAPVAPVVEEIPVAPAAAIVAASDLPSLSATLADVLSPNALAPISLADILAARSTTALVAAPVAVSRPAAPTTPAARPSRPSPDSPLARVLAAGHRAIARSQSAAATAKPDAVADLATPAATRPATLPGWLTQPRAAMSPAPLPAVVPATTVPRHLPARPTERRLHLA